jgi:hypothetical protein
MKAETLENGNVLARLLRMFAEERTNENAFGILRCLRDSFVSVPCSIRISDEDMEQFTHSQVGDIVQPKGEIGMKPDILINNATQERVLPVFSQDKQIPEEYGANFSRLRMPFIDVCNGMFKGMKDVTAIVVDPFTVSFTLSEELINIVTKLPSEIDEEERRQT